MEDAGRVLPECRDLLIRMRRPHLCKPCASRGTALEGVCAALAAGTAVHQASGRLLLANGAAPTLLRLLCSSPLALDAASPLAQSLAPGAHACGGNPHNLLLRFACRERPAMWLLKRTCVLRQSGSSWGGCVISNFIDITARTEQELTSGTHPAIWASMADKLQLAVAGGAMGLWEFDQRNRRFRWDAAMAEIHGTPAGMQPPDAMWPGPILPEDLDHARPSFVRALSGAGAAPIGFRLQGPGGLRHVVMAAMPLANSTARPGRVQGYYLDVTDATRAEEAWLARQGAIRPPAS